MHDENMIKLECFDSIDHEPPKIKAEDPPPEIPDYAEAGPRPVALMRRKTKDIYRRAFSELSLMEILGPLKKDTSYHVMTAGNIDALSFLKHILKEQPLKYCLFSTWCMAMDDIAQFDEWLTAGRIGRLDGYCGEIFPGTYAKEYAALKPIIEKRGGRVAVFRNHSKVFAGLGQKYAFGIASSANINTNPRTENTVITTSAEAFNFYKDYFDGIKSYTKDFTDWRKWGDE